MAGGAAPLARRGDDPLVQGATLFGAVWLRFRCAAEWPAVIAAGSGLLLAAQILGLADRGTELADLADLADLNDDGNVRALLSTSSEAVRTPAGPALLMAAAAALVGFGHGLLPRLVPRVQYGHGRGARPRRPTAGRAPMDVHPLGALVGSLWVLMASLVLGIGDLIPREDELSTP